ncbi:hypothetical protein [Streptomyces sp. TE33382]
MTIDTLASRAASSGQVDSWCTDPVCGRLWPYDRLDTACTEPATHTVQGRRR